MPNARWVVGSAGQSPQRFRPHYAIVLAVAAFVVCGAFAGSPTGAWAAPRACSVARLAQLQGDQHDLEKLIETDKRNVAQAQQIIKALPTGVLLVPSDGDHLITSAGELVSALQELARKTQVGGAKLEFLIQELRGVGAPVAGVTLDNTLVEIGTAVDVQTAQIVLKGILQQTEDKQWAIQHQFSPPTARELSLVLATMLQQTATKRIKTRKVLNSRLAIIKHEEVALKSARAAVAAEQACLAAAAKAATPAPSPVANPPASVRRAASPFSYSLVPDPPTVERNAQCAEWDPIAGTAKVTYPNGSWAY